MNATFQVFLYERDREASSALGAELSRLGYPAEEIFDLSLFGEHSSLQQQPLLVVQTGHTEQSCLETSKNLIKLTELHKLPLLVVGYRVDEIHSVLGRYFSVLATVPEPWSSADLFRAVSYISKVLGERKTDGKDIRSVTMLRDTSKQNLMHDFARADITAELANELDEVPVALFEQLKQLHLEGVHLNGEAYTDKISLEMLEKRGCLPSDPKVVQAMRAVWGNPESWRANRLFRTSYISCQIFNALDLGKELSEEFRAAIFLFPFGFSIADAKLLRESYLSEDSSELRTQICSKLKDSAYRVAVELGLPHVGNMISAVARLVGQEERVGDDDVSVLASIIMMSDLVDRHCYHTGRWDSRAAYHFIRKLKHGAVQEFPPQVWGCVMKFLSEAITSRTTIDFLSAELRKDPELREELKEFEKGRVGKGEEIIAIPELAPGMRLSQPLYAYDGRKVLSQEILLDQDLVWRIWQLAAIRPLISPVIHRAAAALRKVAS